MSNLDCKFFKPGDKVTVVDFTGGSGKDLLDFLSKPVKMSSLLRKHIIGRKTNFIPVILYVLQKYMAALKLQGLN